MTKTLACVLFMLVAEVIVSAQTSYSTYVNERYAFSVQYPDPALRMKNSPRNSDSGMFFRSRNGDAEMFVLARADSADLELHQIAHIFRYRYLLGSEDSSEKSSPQGFVLTGTLKKSIYFIKTIRHRFSNISIDYTLFIKYPKAGRKKSAPLVAEIADSFKVDPIANVRP